MADSFCSLFVFDTEAKLVKVMQEDDVNLLELIGVMGLCCQQGLYRIYFSSIVQISVVVTYLLNSLSFLLKLFLKVCCYFIKIYMHLSKQFVLL